MTHGNDPDKAGEKLKAYLQVLNREMLNREYIAGDYSLADITYIPFFVRRERYRAIIDESLPHLKGWMDRLLSRALVRATP
ncbi:MAG: glutathione binding-like protein [Candidatus Binatia bacterium]